MPWSLFFVSLGLFLIFEGIMPFVAPQRWKIMMLQIQLLKEHTLRIIGLTSMLLGLAIITCTHYFFYS